MDQSDFSHGFRSAQAGFNGLIQVFQSFLESALLNKKLNQPLQNSWPAFVFFQKSMININCLAIIAECLVRSCHIKSRLTEIRSQFKSFLKICHGIAIELHLAVGPAEIVISQP